MNGLTWNRIVKLCGLSLLLGLAGCVGDRYETSVPPTDLGLFDSESQELRGQPLTMRRQGTLPRHLTIPRHGTLPGHSTLPRHGTLPRMGTLPRHSTLPGHSTLPRRHNTLPRHSTLPRGNR